jgi:hypothetical protein
MLYAKPAQFSRALSIHLGGRECSGFSLLWRKTCEFCLTEIIVLILSYLRADKNVLAFEQFVGE